MDKSLRWPILILLVAVLCGAGFYAWRSGFGHDDELKRAERATFDAREAGMAGEPITPIPLTIKLDARKVALGRRLFFDPGFSKDNKISCAHCHNLATGGVDNLPHSTGADGQEAKANTLTVFNSGFNFRLFWDGRAATLEDQIDFPMRHDSPMQGSGEMDSTWPEVIAKLEADADYRRDFSVIYPEGITLKSVKNAIATFERSLTTPNSKFDRYLRGDAQVLDHDELAGYELFKSLGCISCHQGVNVGGNLYEKLGLVGNYFADRGNVQKVDYGRYNVTGNEDDRYEFRVPSLRNVALTAPYFHDASANTLAAAVLTMAKYQLGVVLSVDELVKIVKFLKTLTGVYQGETEIKQVKPGK